MPTECAFCSSTATLTGEHVWSDWMNPLFAPMEKVTFRKLGHGGMELKKFTSPRLNLKTKVVCGPCNNGWMSALEENAAKPAMADLIVGNHIGEISKKRAKGLSLFAFKTAVVLNRSLPESEVFFTDSERHAFRESLTIPPNVAMFLVCMEKVNGGGAGSFSVFYPNRGLSLNVCSFWIGQLGFQVVSAKGSVTEVRRVESLPTPRGLTVRFYPELDPQIRWPRKKVLSAEEFDKFSNRWNAIRRI